MSNFKRLIAFLMAIGLVGSLGACSRNRTNDEEILYDGTEMEAEDSFVADERAVPAHGFLRRMTSMQTASHGLYEDGEHYAPPIFHTFAQSTTSQLPSRAILMLSPYESVSHRILAHFEDDRFAVATSFTEIMSTRPFDANSSFEKTVWFSPHNENLVPTSEHIAIRDFSNNVETELSISSLMPTNGDAPTYFISVWERRGGSEFQSIFASDSVSPERFEMFKTNMLSAIEEISLNPDTNVGKDFILTNLNVMLHILDTRVTQAEYDELSAAIANMNIVTNNPATLTLTP